MAEFSMKEVINAILNNDTTNATKMLEEFNFTKNDTPTHFTSDYRTLASTMLSLASAISSRNALDGNLAKELVERTTMSINIFPFTRLIVATVGIKADNFDIIPKRIREALCNNKFEDTIGNAIEKLNDDAFAALLVLISTDKIKQLNVYFTQAIMRRIQKGKIIPENLMLAYMAIASAKIPQKALYSTHYSHRSNHHGGVAIAAPPTCNTRPQLRGHFL